ncbi:MAG: response regulator transcription factor [Thermoleophilia bacterium]|nr:response regulator transcription factor [Thermoleophilia bacterium]
METGDISVLVVEDNDVFRDALELMLGFVPDLRVAGAVADGEEAVHACAALRPDVVLLDYRLPGLDGVEAARAIGGCSDAAVVALTAAAEPSELEALRGAGAVACLSKDSDVDAIVAAIRAAARGRAAHPLPGGDSALL